MNGRYRALCPTSSSVTVFRRALSSEPLSEPLGPCRVPPDELALRVVQCSLVDGSVSQLVQVRGGADVVGMEVRNEDARNPSACGVELRAPELLHVGEADTGVDDRPAIVSG